MSKLLPPLCFRGQTNIVGPHVQWTQLLGWRQNTTPCKQTRCRMRKKICTAHFARGASGSLEAYHTRGFFPLALLGSRCPLARSGFVWYSDCGVPAFSSIANFQEAFTVLLLKLFPLLITGAYKLVFALNSPVFFANVLATVLYSPKTTKRRPNLFRSWDLAGQLFHWFWLFWDSTAILQENYKKHCTVPRKSIFQ